MADVYSVFMKGSPWCNAEYRRVNKIARAHLKSSMVRMLICIIYYLVNLAIFFNCTVFVFSSHSVFPLKQSEQYCLDWRPVFCMGNPVVWLLFLADYHTTKAVCHLVGMVIWETSLLNVEMKQILARCHGLKWECIQPKTHLFTFLY